MNPSSTPRLLAAVLASFALVGLVLAGPAESRVPRAHVAEASHAGWPTITGMTLMNKRNQSRPL